MDNLKQYYDKIVNVNGTFPEFEHLIDSQKETFKNSLGFAAWNLSEAARQARVMLKLTSKTP